MKSCPICLDPLNCDCLCPTCERARNAYYRFNYCGICGKPLEKYTCVNENCIQFATPPKE
jgi:hypothetical protein